MKVELVACTPNPIWVIEDAARTCYQSEPKGELGTLAKKAIKLGHWSVIEHAYATFRISGCSRAMTHQLVRHRLMAISQKSQRYCDEAGMYDRDYYIVPKAIKDMVDVRVGDLIDVDSDVISWGPDNTVGQVYHAMMADADVNYHDLQEIIAEGKKLGLTKAKKNEDARYVLPNACMSEIVISANFRELRHIFTVRCDKHAQWEIRAVAIDMLHIMQEVAPVIFDDFTHSILPDGTRIAQTEYPT